MKPVAYKLKDEKFSKVTSDLLTPLQKRGSDGKRKKADWPHKEFAVGSAVYDVMKEAGVLWLYYLPVYKEKKPEVEVAKVYWIKADPLWPVCDAGAVVIAKTAKEALSMVYLNEPEKPEVIGYPKNPRAKSRVIISNNGDY